MVERNRLKRCFMVFPFISFWHNCFPKGLKIICSNICELNSFSVANSREFKLSRFAFSNSKEHGVKGICYAPQYWYFSIDFHQIFISASVERINLFYVTLCGYCFKNIFRQVECVT